MLWFEQPKCSHCLSMMGTSNKAAFPAAILNLHERIENKLFLDRTRKDSNFKRPHICATLFQIEKCCFSYACEAAADVFAVKIAQSGGLQAAGRVGDIADAAGVGLYGGTMLEAGIG